MNWGNRRESYRGERKHTVSIFRIPTWKEANEDTNEESSNYYKKFEFKPNNEMNNKISIYVGDITTLQVDALVNQTDESLSGGAGMAEAGRELLYECSRIGYYEFGSAKITKGCQLPAKYVIHTVGPVDENRLVLQNCYQYSLFLAKENGLRTIAFPCISTGNYIYPHEKAAHVALKAVREFMESYGACITQIVFCVWDPINIEIYKKMLHLYFPLPSVFKEPKPLTSHKHQP